MDILVAGGHGQVALRLLKILADQGHRARGIIRKPEQAADLEAVGAVPVLGDLENDDSLAGYVRGADAVVFAAGAGPGSGAARKKTVDLGGAVKLADAAKAEGVRRYVMVSSIGADRPESAGDAMRPYLEAKAQADDYVRASGLDWTIVRPGSLTDEPGTGRVRVSRHHRPDVRAVRRRHPDRRGPEALAEPGVIGRFRTWNPKHPRPPRWPPATRPCSRPRSGPATSPPPKHS
jgi:uncharacterized protein YbjT (DUF2867 family)